MTIMDKLKFWKKPETELPDLPPLPSEPTPPSAGAPAGLESMGMPSGGAGITEPPKEPMPEPSMPMPGVPERTPSMPTPGTPSPSVPSPSAQQPQSSGHQLISSKLDTIKAQLDVVIHRLERLETKDERTYQRRWQ